MASNPDDARIAALIGSISSRDSDRLASLMLARCWPGGVADRSEAVALEWVSRWGPARAVTPQLECACASGYCAVCN